MSVISNNILAGSSGQGGAAGGYAINRSLRFNSGDSAYLNRTPSSAGNRKTWTWSGWVKRTEDDASKRGLFGVNGTNAMIRFNNDDGGSNLRVLDPSTGGFDVITKAKFRDLSSWYHFVIVLDTTQGTAADRVKVYVNGVQETTFFSASYPTQNQDLTVNTAGQHNIGRTGSSNNEYLNGYLADIHFIDGQALAPSDFGEFDDNGVWQPKAYAGTYGTNGFHLPFSDNSSNAALGTDTSGNGNTWTVNNLSVTAGAGNDSLVDYPEQRSDQTDTGVGGEVVGNYATLNPLAQSNYTTLSNGNLAVITTNISHWGSSSSTIGMSSGKWYLEVNGGAKVMIGISSQADSPANGDYHAYSYGFTFFSLNGNHYNSATPTSYGSTWTSSSDVAGAIFDADNGTLSFTVNGASQGTAFTGLDTSLTWHFVAYTKDTSPVPFNFGQRAFAYTAPSGYKCLCTANLPDPTIADGSTYFDTKLYTGNGGTQTISGLEFSPDFVWIKSRTSTNGHNLYDSVRGANKYLSSHLTAAEGTATNELMSFDSDGFSLGNAAGVNGSSKNYVAWAWDAGGAAVSNTDGSITSQVSANQTHGFSIVTATASSAGDTIGHGLNAPLSLIIAKRTNATSHWPVYHSSVGANGFTYLNLTNAAGTGSDFWNNVTPTSSVFTVGSDSAVSGGSAVFYCWSEVAGYSKISIYTGNGSADGPFVFTGFRPRWVLIKATSIGQNWYILDAARDLYNLTANKLEPNTSNQENASPNTATTNSLDLLSNGFKLRTSNDGTNQSSATYIYAAFAEHPFKTSRAR